MRRLEIGGVKLKELYVAESSEDMRFARKHGIAAIRMPNGWTMDDLVKYIIYPVFRRMLPHVVDTSDMKNRKRIGDRIRVVKPVRRDTELRHDAEINEGIDIVSDDKDDYRVTVAGGEVGEVDYDRVKLSDYLGTEWETDVNVETLQAVGMLPKFMSDITEAVKHNLSSVAWYDGWNKKYDLPIGRPGYSREAPNLMILDVSGSIPGGVALTMVKIIDSLREQANADLIVTGSHSWWYPLGNDMPDPEFLAARIGGANEIVAFQHIMEDHIAGKHYGNLIVFGDDDAPDDQRFTTEVANRRFGEGTRKAAQGWAGFLGKIGTRIDNIMAFHTRNIDKIPGYGKWAKIVSPNATVQYSNEWTTYFDDDSKRRW